MSLKKKLKSLFAVGAAALSLFAFNPNALAFQEYPIGDEIEDTVNHFKVALVYFQPVPMEPQGMMLPPDQADIHIETDIHATEGIQIYETRRRSSRSDYGDFYADEC